MNPNFQLLLTRKVVIPASVGIAAFSGGVGLGYILGKRRKYVQIETSPARTISLVKTAPDNWSIDDTPPTHFIKEGKLVSWGPTTDENAPGHIVSFTPLDEDEELETTITVEDDPDWDYAKEIDARDPMEPYIIHRDEFFNDEKGYTQTTVSYYEGDDVLTDELNTPIYGFPAMVGELKWGHGSGDQNVVYIRNELLEHEWEVCRDPGHYAVEVLGLEIDHEYQDRDLKHSKVQKFRMD